LGGTEILFADETPSMLSNALSIGIVFASICTLLGGIFLVLQIVKIWKGITSPSPNSMFVTRGELDSQTALLREDMTRVQSELKDSITKLDEYSHRRLHEISDAVHSVGLKLAEMKAEIGAQVRSEIDRAIVPLYDKINRTHDVVVRLDTTRKDKEQA
jgi:hypothetical protein